MPVIPITQEAGTGRTQVPGQLSVTWSQKIKRVGDERPWVQSPIPLGGKKDTINKAKGKNYSAYLHDSQIQN